MKMNLRKTYYLITLSALALVAVVGLLLMPGVNTSGTVSAQDGRAQVATADMINYALMHKANDLSATYGFINQLPCTEIAGESLAGRTVKPGVYCLSSANLAGDIVLDGEGDAKSTFIFRVAGSLNAKGVDVSVTNEAMASNVHFVAESATLSERTNFNGNILTRKAINVEDGSSLKGSTRSISGEVVAAESAVLGAGTGSLQICKNVVVPAGGAGTALDLRNRIFNFEVTSARLGTTQTVRVVANSCSTARDIPTGLNTIRELNTGQVFDNSPGGSGQVTGNFNGQFELIGVEDITNPRSTSGFGQTNLQERTQVVNIVEGGTTTELAVRFTNRFAITGFVQICKQAATGSGLAAPDTTGLTATQAAAATAAAQLGANPAGTTPLSGGDPNVTGFFQFTIEGVFAAPTTADPGSENLRVFTAPVGGCTNAIAVTIGDPVPTTTIPRMSTVNITELGNDFGRTDFFLEDIYTLIADRNNFEVLGAGIGADGEEFDNPGGGYINVDVFEASGSANETLVVFVDRSNPGLFKVCKVGGPGIPVNTLFRFRVRGIGPTTADGLPPEGPDFGLVTRFVDVRAGSPLEPTCQFVPGFGGGAGNAEFQTFVNGTRVDVEELGISLDNLVAVPALGPGSTAEVRTSRITTTTSFTTPGVTASFNPNPNFTPVGTGPISDTGTRRVSAASTVGRMGTTIVEFTNVIFNPTVLKVCKIGTGTISTAGDRSFTFDVNFVPPTGVNGVSLFDPQFTGTRTVTAAAGTAADGGFCTIVSPTGLLGGAFNIGSTFTITERSQTGVTVSGITSPSGTPISGVDLTARTATVGGLVGGVNTVTFTNTNTPGGVDGGDGTLAAVPFDFDGDRKSDLSIYRGGTWWYAASSANGQQRATTFGLATDKTVPADYDGDGKSDNAVYRGGIWHILGSRDGYTGIQFGLAGDIPQAGDFDGDKKADVAVFRPSNGVWYMMGSRDGFMAVQFGANGDVPVAADFDGDNKMDPAVYRNGTWFMLRSKDGFAAPGFGLPTDIPVAADYDGDKKADIAVYRGGTWYQLRSTEGFRSLQLGISTDQPVPADYDGDSKADAAVYRGGIWYMIRSGQSGEAESVQFGVSSDVPVPASFLRR